MRVCHEWVSTPARNAEFASHRKNGSRMRYTTTNHTWECVTNERACPRAMLMTRPPPAHRKNGSRMRHMTNERVSAYSLFRDAFSFVIRSRMRHMTNETFENESRMRMCHDRVSMHSLLSDTLTYAHSWHILIRDENVSRKSEYARVQRRNCVIDEWVKMEKSPRMNDSQWNIRYEWERVTNESAPLRQRALMENASRWLIRDGADSFVTRSHS